MQINLILDRICAYYQLDRKKDLADKLGVKPTVISNWLSRNTIDWNLIFTKCEDISFDYLIKGNPNTNIASNLSQSDALYKELYEQEKEANRSLNREIGKLQLTIEQLKKGNAATSFGLVAEPKLDYKNR
jgi:hypothetical protein